MKRKLIWLLIITVVIINTSCVRKKPTTEYVFTYAENHPKDYPTTLGAFEFARLVEEKSNGRIAIEVVYDGKLGDELSVIKQLKFGGIDFTRASISPLSNDIAILNVLQMPYLYRDEEHMWNVLYSEIGDEILAQFEGSGIEPLSFYTAGARNFYNNMIRALGAEPVAQEYSLVYGSLERGVIDGAENNIPSYISAMHYQYAKYYTKDEHTRVPEMQLCSDVTWSKLSEKDRAIIKEAAIESSIYEREIWAKQEKIYEKELVDKGIEINTLSGEERANFKKILEPLYEKYCKDYMDLINIINEK